jgi:hypothetical protein
MFQLKLVSNSSHWVEKIQREFINCPRVIAICGSLKEIPTDNAVFASTFHVVEEKNTNWLHIPFRSEYAFFLQALRTMKAYSEKSRSLVVVFSGNEDIHLIRKAYNDFIIEQDALAKFDHLVNHARY